MYGECNNKNKFTKWRLAVFLNKRNENIFNSKNGKDPTQFGVKHFQGIYLIFSINSVLQQRKQHFRTTNNFT